MANVIEIVAKMNDHATPGVVKLSTSVGLLANAIGIGAGYGLIGTVTGLTRALVDMAKAPFDAANALAELARKGENVNAVFYDLARAQTEARAEWKKTMDLLAQDVVPLMIKAANFAQAFAGALRLIRNANSKDAGWTFGTDPGTGANLPAIPTDEQLELAKKLAEELEKRNKAIADARRLTSGYGLAPIPEPRRLASQTPGSMADYQKILGDDKQKPIDLKQISEDAISAAQRITDGIASAATALVTGLQTIGQVAKAFWVELVGFIMSQLADLAAKNVLGPLFGAIGTAIGGPLGGVIGGIAGGFMTRAGGPRGAGATGNTIIFQGINTRDAFMSFAYPGGELRRANDRLVLAGEAG